MRMNFSCTPKTQNRSKLQLLGQFLGKMTPASMIKKHAEIELKFFEGW